MENRTSAAKAGYGSVIYGTAEPVSFQDPVFTQTLCCARVDQQIADRARIKLVPST